MPCKALSHTLFLARIGYLPFNSITLVKNPIQRILTNPTKSLRNQFSILASRVFPSRGFRYLWLGQSKNTRDRS
ncbi:hypothetical protein Bca4012_050694 [Brassica carinata]